VNEFDSLCSCQPNVLRVQPPVTFSFFVGFTRIVKGRLGKMLTLMATLMLFGGNWADVRHWTKQSDHFQKLLGNYRRAIYGWFSF